MSHVRIRMYRQGLGDCFLLSFPAARKRPFHMLVDCGVLKGTENGQERIREVAADVLKTTNKQLDVLVVTHEHWDHISGFAQAQEIFDRLSIGCVWAGWTENESTEAAKLLRKKREKAKKALRTAAKRLRGLGTEAAATSARRVNHLLGFFGDLGITGGASTHEAMQWALKSPKRHVRFCHPGEKPIRLPGVKGVRVFVLGPPTDENLIHRSRPRKSAGEVYGLATAEVEPGFFAAVTNMETAASSRRQDQPFDPWREVRDEEAKSAPFFQEHYGFTPGDVEAWRRIEGDWLSVAERLALQLDNDTNNTSLALAIELPSGRVLLFPGDAQVGNWLSWDSLGWKIRNGDGEREEVSAEDLLRRTVFYKVSHHASHNATLREHGLEMMQSPELIACIPVDKPTAQKLRWNMPFGPLLTRLEEKSNSRVLQLDDGIGHSRIPQQLPPGYRIRETTLYVDLEIPL